MRQIKFRGKELCNYLWVNGFYTQGGFLDPDTGEISIRHLISSDVLHDIDPDTLGQFTGIQDTDGRDIYEGDIVRRHTLNGYDIDYIGVVFYEEKEAAFKIEWKIVESKNENEPKGWRRIKFWYDENEEESSDRFIYWECEDGQSPTISRYEYRKIGNIFENKELLEL